MVQKFLEVTGCGILLAAVLVVTGCMKPTVHWSKPQISWEPVTMPSKVEGWLHKSRSLAIPDTYPLGSVVRAPFHTMQRNGEAADFIIHRNEFDRFTAALTPDGRDHIANIAARARSAPFPIVVERSENNSNPELDAHRRRIVAQILADFGVPEADQRTVVAPAYGRPLNGNEAVFDYNRFVFSRGFGGTTGGGGGSGVFGGGGGGGFGGRF